MSEEPAARQPAGAAVFLDRDGVLVDELDFLTDPDDLRLLPGAAQAVLALNRSGVPAVLVTNQSAVARGLVDERGLAAIHARLAERLAARGAHLDGVYVCPHHPTEGRPPYRVVCDCRKPAPGLLMRAARDLDLDLSRSWIIGDSARDLEAGAAAGVRGVLVETGKGAAQRARMVAAGRPPERVARDVREAVRMVLAAGTRAHS